MITADKLDMALLCNSNDPIFVGGFPVYPVPIRQIRRMGYNRYKMNLAILCLTEEDISRMMEGIHGAGAPFFFLLSVLAYKENERQDIIDAFRMVCREDITWDMSALEIRTSSGVLREDNFRMFQDAVRQRNQYEVDTADENPADEFTRQLMQRSRELDAKRAKARGEDGGVTLADLVSICAAKLQVHPDVIGTYDMYQLHDMLGRFKIFDDYEINIQALLHGAKKEDIDISHWISGNKSLFHD